MNAELKKIAADTLEKCKKYGADASKAVINQRRFIEVNYRERRLDKIKEATSRRLSLDIFVDEKYSSQSTPDLREDSLDQFVKQSIENTKFLTEDPDRSLPDTKYFGSAPDTDFKLADPEYDNITPASRHELAREVENACLIEGGDKVISVEAGTNDSINEQVFMTSNGFEGYRKTTQFWALAEMTIQDVGDRRPNGYHRAGARILNDLPDAKQVGTVTARRTLDLMGGKKIPTETLPIIVEIAE